MSATSSQGEPSKSRAFLHRATDAVFVLNRRRHLLFANPAWERLAGVSLDDCYNMACTRRGETPLAQTLCPPSEVMVGKIQEVRRPAPPARVGPPWWDIAFFPLAGHHGVSAILGRIRVVTPFPGATKRAWPDSVLQLRHRLRDRYRFEAWASANPAMHRLLEQAQLAASTTRPVSIWGPPGSGKLRLARTIHYHGCVADKPMLMLDAAALPVDRLEETAFSCIGLGRPEAVGTLAIRHAHRLARETQARLAEWLRDQTAASPRLILLFERLPQEERNADRLLDSLHWLVTVQTLAIPPLRERREDLSRLVSIILAPTVSLTPEAMEMMGEYSWPGNLAELTAVLHDAREKAGKQAIAAEHLPSAMHAEVGRAMSVAASPPPPATPPMPLTPMLEEIERRMIARALRQAKGVKAEAARLLDWNRNKLIRRMNDLQIEPLPPGGHETPADRDLRD